MRRFLLRCSLILLIAISFFPLHTLADSRLVAVKAGFIFNFFKFIEWPADALKTDYFNLCFFNAHEDMKEALQLLEGKNVNGKILKIMQNTKIDELPSCHIVYLEALEPHILKYAEHYPVVTISDSNDFIKKGGTIGLIFDDERLSFEINLQSTQLNGVKIGAPMLKLAKTILNNK